MAITTLAEFNAANTTHDREMKLKLARVMKNWNNYHPELQRYAMELLGETEWFKPELGTIQDMKAHHVFGLIRDYKKQTGSFPSLKLELEGINVGNSLNAARSGVNATLEALLNAEYGDAWKAKSRQSAQEIFQLIVLWEKENGSFPGAHIKVGDRNIGWALSTARTGRNKKLDELMTAKYGNSWKKAKPSAQEIFQHIVNWKKDNQGFPFYSYEVDGVRVGYTLSSARSGKNKALAALLDAEYGDEWRQTGSSPRKKKV